MKNTNVLKEINEMKYLFDYQRGRVISEQSNLDEEGPVSIGVPGVPTPTPTPTTVAGSSTTTKTTRKATGLEVQKLLNTKFSSGLKEDGRVGPLTLGAIMSALEGSTGGSTGDSTTTTTTVAGQTTTTTTTVAGGTSTNAPSTGGPVPAALDY